MLIIDPKKWDPLFHKVSEELFGDTRGYKGVGATYLGYGLN